MIHTYSIPRRPNGSLSRAHRAARVAVRLDHEIAAAYPRLGENGTVRGVITSDGGPTSGTIYRLTTAEDTRADPVLEASG